MKKRLLAILIAILMVFGTVSVSNVSTIEVKAASGLTLAQLQAKFPAGRYWNHVGGSNNPDGTTTTPCPSHAACSTSGSCGCNCFSGAIQCMGFAYKLGYDAFGSSPRSWSKSYDINSVKPGDVIRYVTSAGNGHSIFVTGVTATTITFGDCNYGNMCRIRWNVTVSKSSIAATLQYIQVAPSTLSGGSSSSSQETTAPATTPTTEPATTTTTEPATEPTVDTSHDPVGDIDYIYYLNGVIRYGGWCFDPDDLSASVQIHIYFGGPAGSADAEGHCIIANQVRADVDAAYPGAGVNHGYYGTFVTQKTGTVPIYVYEINIGEGTNKMIWTEDLPVGEPADAPESNLASFTDVRTTDWYYEYVKNVYDKGIMTGVSETDFGATLKIARAQFATILYRMAGSPDVTNAASFKDVASGQWYSDAISWCASVGVITGYSSGYFGISDNITREQIATMLYRYAKYQGVADEADVTVLASFSDCTKVSSFAKEAMAWAVDNGIITGTDGGAKLSPLGTATRAEAATMITRYLAKF